MKCPTFPVGDEETFLRKMTIVTCLINSPFTVLTRVINLLTVLKPFFCLYFFMNDIIQCYFFSIKLIAFHRRWRLHGLLWDFFVGDKSYVDDKSLFFQSFCNPIPFDIRCRPQGVLVVAEGKDKSKNITC